jgi:hypothetical protein
LFVKAIQPAANVNPITINRVNGTIGFIMGSVSRRMIFFNNCILLGNETLQFGFQEMAE